MIKQCEECGKAFKPKLSYDRYCHICKPVAIQVRDKLTDEEKRARKNEYMRMYSKTKKRKEYSKQYMKNWRNLYGRRKLEYKIGDTYGEGTVVSRFRCNNGAWYYVVQHGAREFITVLAKEILR